MEGGDTPSSFKPVRFRSEKTTEFLQALIDPRTIQNLKNGQCKIGYFTDVYRRLREKHYPIEKVTDRIGGSKVWQKWRNLKQHFLMTTARMMRENELGGRVQFGVLKYPHYNYILVRKVMNVLEKKSDIHPQIHRRRRVHSSKGNKSDELEINLPNNKILVLSSTQDRVNEDYVTDNYPINECAKDVKNEIEELDPLAFTEEFYNESDVELSEEDMDQEYNEILEELECDMSVGEDEKLLEKLECVISGDGENDHKIEEVSNDHSMEEVNVNNDHSIDVNESIDHKIEELSANKDHNIDVNVSNDHKYGQRLALSHYKAPDENILKVDEKYSKMPLEPTTVFDISDLAVRFSVQEKTEEYTHMEHYNPQMTTGEETLRPTATPVNTSIGERVILVNTLTGETELNTSSNRTKVHTSILERKLSNRGIKLTTQIGRKKVTTPIDITKVNTPSGETEVNTPSGETNVNTSMCETELYSFLNNSNIEDSSPSDGHKAVTTTSETKVSNPIERNKVTTTTCGTKVPSPSSCCAYAHALMANMNALAEQNLAMTRNMTESMKNFFEMQKAFLQDQRGERKKTNQLLELVLKMVAEK